MEINFVMRKNGDHQPISLGGRSIVVVSSSVSETKYVLAACDFLKFNNFIYKAQSGYLNGFMMTLASYQ